MFHTGNISQHELLKSDAIVPIMVALRTVFTAHYDRFFFKFFPSFICNLFSNLNMQFHSVLYFLTLFEQQFPSIFSPPMYYNLKYFCSRYIFVCLWICHKNECISAKEDHGIFLVAFSGYQKSILMQSDETAAPWVQLWKIISNLLWI